MGRGDAARLPGPPRRSRAGADAGSVRRAVGAARIRQGWGGGKLNATTALLSALAAADRQAAGALAGELDPETRARVLAASEGNPLFLEEMAALARERGTVERPGHDPGAAGRAAGGASGEEREVLECAAVEGEVFHRDALSLVRERPRARSTRAREPRAQAADPAEPVDAHRDDAFRFRHVLIRDAAYEAVPTATRGQLASNAWPLARALRRPIAERDESPAGTSSRPCAARKSSAIRRRRAGATRRRSPPRRGPARPRSR